MTKPEFIYETFIRATAEQVWDGLTKPEFTRRYFYATAVDSGWGVGDQVIYRGADGMGLVEGEVLEVERPARLSLSWRALYDEDMAAEPPSRVTFEIEAMGAVTRLRVTHDRFEEGSKTLAEVSGGWPGILCSLKSLLETGEPLALAGNESEAAA